MKALKDKTSDLFLQEEDYTIIEKVIIGTFISAFVIIGIMALIALILTRSL